MDADDGEENPRRSEDETAARKRSRRVSFADTTAIHIFDRDEDYETPPDTRTSESPSSAAEVAEPPVVGLDGASEEEDEDEELIVKEVLELSPGSATGSVTSNDDENLFGPVSMSFMNSGRSSEASEDNNHDITLDSTAFSLHFRNVLPLEDHSGCSAGSLRTPTGDSLPDNNESSLFLTGDKKYSRLTPNQLTGDANSNFSRMSLVTETPREFDFGKISPNLEALLVEVNQSIQMETPNKTSIVNQVDTIQLPTIDGSSIVTPQHGGTTDADFPITGHLSCGTVLAKSESDMTPLSLCNGHKFSPNQGSQMSSEDNGRSDHVGIENKMSCQTQPISSPSSTLNSHSALALNSKEQPDSSKVGSHTSFAADVQIKSPSMKSFSPSCTKHDVLMDPPILLQNQQALTPIASMFSHSKTNIIGRRNDENIVVGKKGMSGSTCNELHDVDAFRFECPQTDSSPKQTGCPQTASKFIQTGFLSPRNEKISDIPSHVIPDIVTGTNQLKKDDTIGSSRLKLEYQITRQGLYVPISVQTLASLSGCQMTATPEAIKGCVDKLYVSPGGEGGLSSIKTKRHIYTEVFTTHSSPRVNSGTPERKRGLLAFENLLSLQHSDLPSKKWKGEEVPLKDAVIKDKTGGDHMSPKVLHANAEFVSRSDSVNSGDIFELTTPAKSWKDILAKLLAVACQQFSSSLDFLDAKEIDILDYMLGLLEISWKYESLHSGIKSKRRNHLADYKHLTQETKVKLLQVMVLCKRAKLTLMHAKRDILLKKVGMLHAGLDECHKLKALVPVKKRSNHESVYKDISSYPNFSTQEKQAIIAKEEKLGGLERKLRGLIHFFEGFCKLKQNGDHDAFIDLINNHLSKRRHCRDIRHDLLLWIVDDVVINQDGCMVVLNYRDIVSQSFSVKSLRGSSMSFRSSLSIGTIEKRFPNMKASIAVQFIFSNMMEHEFSDSECLQNVTQMTNVLLSNILYLLEEVQAIRLAIPNLISTVFNSSSATQLGLDLCFRGREELILTLDVSDLNSGVYPSEPSKVQIKAVGSRNATPSSVANEVESAIRRLDGGHLMIKRLCKCISDIIGALS